MMIYLQAIDSPEDKAKFEQVYRAYRGLMFHIANAILKNEHDAEDAVHNAFLTIARNISKLEEPRGPRTRSYVSIVCESRAIDLYRKRQKEQTEELLELDSLRAATLEGQSTNALTNCILQLPPQDREIILLRYRHGYSVQEIAEILDIAHETAKKREQRARARLHEICRKEGVL